MKAISKSHGLILMMLINLGLISDVKCDCTNSNGIICTGIDCCYDGKNGIPPILGDPGTIVPVQDCYTPDDSKNEVTFTCDDDGYLKGPPFNNCNNGAWDFPFGSTCEGITSCPQPPVPTNGAISPNQEEYDFYIRIYYSCNTGYSLVGPSEAVCESGAVWNPSTTPTCEADCMRPSLTNGGVVPDRDTFSNGQVLSYQCNANYTLVGVSTTTCRDGVFDPATLPTCYIGMCNPPIVENSDYSTQRSPVDHASIITINCDLGYSTGSGTDKDLTCTDGEFDDEPPVCYANCPPLTSGIDSGVRIGDTAPFYHNEKVSYTCNDGVWTEYEPVCEADCMKPSLTNGGVVPDKDIFKSGEVLTYECDTNYSLVGVSTATCRNGVFDPATVPTCYGTV